MKDPIIRAAYVNHVCAYMTGPDAYGLLKEAAYSLGLRKWARSGPTNEGRAPIWIARPRAWTASPTTVTAALKLAVDRGEWTEIVDEQELLELAANWYEERQRRREARAEAARAIKRRR